MEHSSGSNRGNLKCSRQSRVKVSSFIHAKPQLLENSWARNRAGLRSPLVRLKIEKMWIYFALRSLLVKFGGPAGGDPT